MEARQNKGKTVTEPWDLAMRRTKRLPEALVAAYGMRRTAYVMAVLAAVGSSVRVP